MPQILTPTGYRPVSECKVGDLVVSAQSRTRHRLLNAIQSIERCDENEWQRWHNFKDVPDFVSYRINDDLTLFSEQSIVHNDGKVTHAKHLRPGNRIFFRGAPVTVKRLRKIDAAPWHRLDIDGDHTYIGDGMALHNASRFWVGGTGTWDLSDTTHWSASSGGAAGASAPGSSDTCTFDGSSGGGTVTPSYGGTGTFQSITCGAFGGTLAWNTNNNNVTLSSVFTGSGTGTRTISLGNGTWTFTSTSSSANIWNIFDATNLTFNANSSVLDLTANSVGLGNRSFQGGARTYATVKLGAQTAGGTWTMSGINTFSTLTITGQCITTIQAAQTISTLNLVGSSSGQIALQSDNVNTQRTLTVTTLVADWTAFRAIIMSGSGLAATSSFDCGGNSGYTITPPSAGGGGTTPQQFSMVGTLTLVS